MRTSLVAKLLKNLPAMQETLVRLLGWEDPLEKGKLPTPVSSLENSMDRKRKRKGEREEEKNKFACHRRVFKVHPFMEDRTTQKENNVCYL